MKPIEKPKAMKVSDRYRALGMVTDTQRAILYTIIDRSKDGKWTRYSDMPEDIDAKPARISEMLEIKGIPLKMRTVTAKCKRMGKKIHLSEFCV